MTPGSIKYYFLNLILNYFLILFYIPFAVFLPLLLLSPFPLSTLHLLLPMGNGSHGKSTQSDTLIWNRTKSLSPALRLNMASHHRDRSPICQIICQGQIPHRQAELHHIQRAQLDLMETPQLNIPQEYLLNNIHIKIPHNSQNLEGTQMPLN